MLFLDSGRMAQAWMFPRDIALLTGYKSATRLLSDFRRFVEERPNYFNPLKPIDGDEGPAMQYSPLCVLHYKENKDLLDAGSRSLSFKEDLPRLSDAYQWYFIDAVQEDELQRWQKEMEERLRKIEETEYVLTPKVVK